MYVSCMECGLKTCILYNKKDVFVSEAEEDMNNVHVVELTPGLVMIDTGCRAAVGGQAWHRGLQKRLKGLGKN